MKRPLLTAAVVLAAIVALLLSRGDNGLRGGGNNTSNPARNSRAFPAPDPAPDTFIRARSSKREPKDENATYRPEQLKTSPGQDGISNIHPSLSGSGFSKNKGSRLAIKERGDGTKTVLFITSTKIDATGRTVD